MLVYRELCKLKDLYVRKVGCVFHSRDVSASLFSTLTLSSGESKLHLYITGQSYHTTACRPNACVYLLYGKEINCHTIGSLCERVHSINVLGLSACANSSSGDGAWWVLYTCMLAQWCMMWDEHVQRCLCHNRAMCLQPSGMCVTWCVHVLSLPFVWQRQGKFTQWIR